MSRNIIRKAVSCFVAGSYLLLAAALSFADSTTNTYDELDRLTKTQYSDGTIVEYVYDKIGNMTARNVTVPPVGSFVINSGAAATNSTSAILTLTCSDTNGCAQMQFSNDNTIWSAIEAYAASKNWTLTPGAGTKTVFAKYKNNVGNWTAALSDTIVLETTAPTGTIAINAGAAVTNSTAANLTLSCSDANGCSWMQFSNDNATWSTAQAYATSKAWVLTTGAGTKTVYVKYRDGAGNWTAALSDTIVLDTTAPTGAIVINAGSAATNNTAATLTLSCSDTSGCAQMQFSNDNATWSAAETYAASKAWALTTGVGSKTVYAKYKDTAGNWMVTAVSDTIELETTPPTGTIVINAGAATINSTTATLTLTCSDTNGCAQMQFSNDNSTWSAAEAYATSKAWTLTTGAGTKTVYVKYKDSAGNWMPTAINDTIVLDIPAPTGTISINAGAAATNSTTSTLTLTCSSLNGCAQMQFSNDNTTWSTAETYVTSKAWTLTTGVGTKTVYVKYKDTVGNWSAVINDTINLETTVPTGTIAINAGAVATNSTAATLTLSCSDTSGCSQMQFSNDNTTWSAAEAYATSKSWTLTTGAGTKTVYVKYKDTAGNWMPTAISDTIVLDITAPTGTIAINAGAVATNSTSATLTLSCSDTSGCSQMQFSNDNTTWSAAETYATSKAWTLTTGAGTKTVYVKYKDTAGNWMPTAISDTIILDITAPTGAIAINDGIAVTNSTAVMLVLSCSDTNGCSQMQFSNDNTTWSAPETYAYTKNWTLTTGVGIKTVYGKYKDSAGNWSAVINDTISLEDAAPTGTIAINAGAVATNSTTSTLTLTCSSINGCAQMQFSNDNTTWSAAETYATSKAWTLTTGVGTKTVYVKYKDTAGNWMPTAISDTISLETTAPTGTIAINAGAVATNSTAATLTLSCSDTSGCSQMQLSNDNTTWSAAETFATSKAWTLTTGAGTKTVYVKYKDTAGNWMPTAISDTIVLDITAPTTTATPAAGTYSVTQNVTLSCSDGTGSGCDKIYYTIDGSTPTTASSVFAAPLTVSATSTIKYFAKDKAGNNETVKSGTYTVSTGGATDNGSVGWTPQNLPISVSVNNYNGVSEQILTISKTLNLRPGTISVSCSTEIPVPEPEQVAKCGLKIDEVEVALDSNGTYVNPYSGYHLVELYVYAYDIYMDGTSATIGAVSIPVN